MINGIWEYDIKITGHTWWRDHVPVAKISERSLKLLKSKKRPSTVIF